MIASPATATAPPSLPLFHNFLKEDGLSDETRELVSGLPRKQGWMIDMYLYKGFCFFPSYIQGIVACQNHFKARDTDIILASNPKCGTTWLKAMAFALVNMPVPGVDHPLLSTNPHTLVPFLESNLYGAGDDNLPDLSSFTSPRLFATHIPYGLLSRSAMDSSCKIVYVCRNPKDALVSLWHFTHKLFPGRAGALELQDAFRMFCEGVSPFGPFWDHVLGYWNKSLKSPHKVLFLKYEDMLEQPARHLRRLAEFLGCPFSPEEESKGVVDDISRLCSFDHLSNLEVNKTGRQAYGQPNASYFRKGVVGDSENFLTPPMIEELDRITELKFRDSKLKL